MNLVDQFERAAIATAATVARVPRDSALIATAVAEVARDARSIAISEPASLPRELFAACSQLPGIFTGHSKREFAGIEVGVTEAFAGVARTGSVCICVDEGYAGYTSLLARTHIAILAAETIVDRPSDLFRPNGVGREGLRRNFVFVTGPSATADMGPLVRGVHGPHRLHIIILERE
jgi:L-lactate dehydrogenase complex protein LldG